MTNRCCTAAGLVTADGRLAWGVMLVCLALQGCASTDAIETRPVELAVTLDRAEYNTGDAMIATVTLTNKGEVAMDVPRFDYRSVRFMIGEKGLHARMHRTPVHSKRIMASPRQMEPSGSVSRAFVFTRTTTNAGDFALMASFKGLIIDGNYIRDSIYAAPQTYKVKKHVALRRDPGNGLILKEQAVHLAKGEAKGEVKKARAVLMPLGETGLFTWIVMLRVAESGAERSYAVEVNPYLGGVKPVVTKGKEEATASGLADGGRTETGGGVARKAQFTEVKK